MAELTIPAALQLAVQHHKAGRLSEAEALYREILARDPQCADALHLLGVIAHQVGKHEFAVELIGRAAALAPDTPAVHSNLGEAYRRLNRLDEAVACFQKALELQPAYPEALSNLGHALITRGRGDEALLCYQQAVALKPELDETHNNLGNLFQARGQFDQAVACFQRALALRPDFAEAHNNLGSLFHQRGQLDDAFACYQRALAIKPHLADIYNNLGSLFKDRGQLGDAVAYHRQALALGSDRADIHSNLILALLYRSGHETGLIDAELRNWNQQHALPLAKFTRPHANDRQPNRQLRIGYLSPDFKRHAVTFFLLPLLEGHDHTQFHVTCYSTDSHSDDITARVHAAADGWVSLAGLSDHDAARRIRDDRIDLLIDLAGHTACNRLLVFARKPAPVQVGYLGYPGSTGLAAIDYRLTDAWADSPDTLDQSCAEQVLRLPETAWCFTPLSGCPPVGKLPASDRGHVTFGCFNNFAKATDDMLRTWVRILQRVPRSRLIVKNFSMGSPSVRQRLLGFFTQQNITADRLELIPLRLSPLDHLHCYDHVDLALDTFPYHGTTTTCEALWMGVPVVTLAGHRHVTRVGLSLLSNVGLSALVAHSVDDYIETASQLAHDLPRLAALRAGLRERMQRSPLMDATRFARHIEAAYRDMWHRWCAQDIPTAMPNR